MNRAVLAGALTGGALAVLGWSGARASLAQLDALRLAGAQDAAIAGAADALPDAGFRMAAGSDARVRSIVGARIRRAAGAGGVLIERLAPGAPLGPGLARIELGLSGSEKAVLTLADALEREGAGVRWRRWRLEGASPDTVRLTGEIAVAWR